MNARIPSRPKPPVDSGDGGLFRAIGCAALALGVLVAIAAAVSKWLGDGAGETVLNIGVIVLVAALVIFLTWGGDRR